MSRIDWDQGRRLYLQGKSPREIAAAIKCNKSSVCRKVNQENWQRAETVLAGVARGVSPVREKGGELGESVAKSGDSIKARIREDVSAVLDALDAIPPADLGLGQLSMRERVAGDVAKRASTVFDIGEKDQAVVNIAVLSQLPEQVVEG